MSYRSLGAHISKIHPFCSPGPARCCSTSRESILPLIFSAAPHPQHPAILRRFKALWGPRYISTQPTNFPLPGSAGTEEPPTLGHGAEDESAAIWLRPPSAHRCPPLHSTKSLDAEPQFESSNEGREASRQKESSSLTRDPGQLAAIKASGLPGAEDEVPTRQQEEVHIAATKSHSEAMYGLLYRKEGPPYFWNRYLQAYFPRKTTTDHLRAGAPRELLAELQKDPYRAYLMNMDAVRFVHHWKRLSVPKKRLAWPYGIFRSLHSTEETLKFLLETHIQPFPDFELVMDVMHHLGRDRQEQFASSKGLRELYHRVLVQQLVTLPFVSRLQRKHLLIFFEVLSPGRIKQLFHQIVDAGVELSHHSRMALLTFFTVHQDIDSALQIVKSFPPRFRQRSKTPLLMKCRHLLKLDTIIDDGSSRNFRILPEILEANIRPDLAMFNQVMSNAVKAGASGVAWDLFRHMQDRELTTDAWTYRILLGDAYTQCDSERVEEIMSTIHARKDLYENPVLMVFAILVLRSIGRDENLAPSQTVSSILRLYSRAFTMAPLRQLRIVNQERRLEADGALIEPDTITLSYVVTCYVLAQRSPIAVDSLLDWVEHLRSQRHGLALELTHCRHFYDGFLSFYARSSHTVRRCLEIIRTMIDRDVTPADNTWRLLLAALTKHHLHEAADHLRVLMERRGIPVVVSEYLDDDATEGFGVSGNSRPNGDCDSDSLHEDTEVRGWTVEDAEEKERPNQPRQNKGNVNADTGREEGRRTEMRSPKTQNKGEKGTKDHGPPAVQQVHSNSTSTKETTAQPQLSETNTITPTTTTPSPTPTPTTDAEAHTSWSQKTETDPSRMRRYYFIHLDLANDNNGSTRRTAAAQSVADSSVAYHELRRRGFR